MDLAKLGVRNPKKSQDRGLIDNRKRSIDDEANRLSINKVQSRIIVNNQNRGV